MKILIENIGKEEKDLGIEEKDLGIEEKDLGIEEKDLENVYRTIIIIGIAIIKIYFTI